MPIRRLMRITDYENFQITEALYLKGHGLAAVECFLKDLIAALQFLGGSQRPQKQVRRL